MDRNHCAEARRSRDEGTFVGWLKGDGRGGPPRRPTFSWRAEGDPPNRSKAIDEGILHIPRRRPKPGDKVPSADARPTDGRRGAIRKFARRSSLAPPASSDAAARRGRREMGVDWSNLRETGRVGRIREREVRAAVQSGGRLLPIDPDGARSRRDGRGVTRPRRGRSPTRRIDTNLANLRGSSRQSAVVGRRGGGLQRT